jgi:hypothetical protein
LLTGEQGIEVPRPLERELLTYRTDGSRHAVVAPGSGQACSSRPSSSTSRPGYRWAPCL